MREFKIGTVVRHFKWETDDEDNILKYLYIIKDFAKHTETEEELVIYQSLYSGKVFARPVGMFVSEVDHEKYPNIKQLHRLEIVNCV